MDGGGCLGGMAGPFLLLLSLTHPPFSCPDEGHVGGWVEGIREEKRGGGNGGGGGDGGGGVASDSAITSR